MGVSIDGGSISTSLKNLRAAEKKLLSALEIVSKSASKQMEAYAKKNAKWTDRTGNARQSLSGDSYWADPKTLETVISHHVDYGVWLELAHGRKYAILEEALQSAVPELIQSYKTLVGD